MQITWQSELQLQVILGESIDPHINALILAIDRQIKGDRYLQGFIDETIPSYTSLSIVFNDLALASVDQIQASIVGIVDKIMLERGATNDVPTTTRTIKLPICYGGEYGPDLAFVASHAGISEDEVIQRHTQAMYYVYMLGFTPGFPYLGGMDPKLSAPRLKVPRVKIPAGSCGIAEHQTGIYPQASPGGWQIIGRCPLPLFNPQSEVPTRLLAGDWVQFVPIDTARFEALLLDGGASWDLG